MSATSPSYVVRADIDALPMVRPEGGVGRSTIAYPFDELENPGDVMLFMYGDRDPITLLKRIQNACRLRSYRLGEKYVTRRVGAGIEVWRINDDGTPTEASPLPGITSGIRAVAEQSVDRARVLDDNLDRRYARWPQGRGSQSEKPAASRIRRGTGHKRGTSKYQFAGLKPGEFFDIQCPDEEQARMIAKSARVSGANYRHSSGVPAWFAVSVISTEGSTVARCTRVR